jgi:hypothetical protein
MMITDEERLKLGLENLLDDRDHLYRLVHTIDWDAQLDAISAVLKEHQRSADHVSTNIKVLEEEARTYRGPYHDHVVDEHIDAIWRATYHHAAISLSAAGMIVPTIETILAQALQEVGKRYVARGIAPPDHKRWNRALDHPDRWNVQWYFGKKEGRVDIVSGLPQLCDASGISAHLGRDDLDWIVALFSYRNRMFHGGFEWPILQRQGFFALIAERGWDQYFTWSTRNDEPWIYYLRDEVIDALPGRVLAILGSLGRFAKALPHEVMLDPQDQRQSGVERT